MLKRFFLSERKLLNAILRVKLKYMKIFLSHEMKLYCNAEDRYPFIRAFCRASHVRASRHRITSLELLRTLMLCLVQLSNVRPQMLKGFFLSERKLLMQLLRVKLQYMKMFPSHEKKCYLQCKRQIFMC